MSLTAYLPTSGATFGPEAAATMAKAFEDAVSIIGIGPRDEIKREAVARFILHLPKLTVACIPQHCATRPLWLLAGRSTSSLTAEATTKRRMTAGSRFLHDDEAGALKMPHEPSSRLPARSKRASLNEAVPELSLSEGVDRFRQRLPAIDDNRLAGDVPSLL
jgi:hypothetical protein